VFPESVKKKLTPGQGTTLLGHSIPALVYDLHQGCHPNGLGASGGAVVGGGLMVLLTPPLDQWPVFADPEYARLLVANYQTADIQGRFLTRLVNIIQHSTDLLCCPQQGLFPDPDRTGGESPQTTVLPATGSDDQQQALAAIFKVVQGHRRRPAVLIADRGRGKSAALGMAAARLLGQGLRRIIVTAPRLAAVDTLFEHAAAGLPGVQIQRGLLQWQGGVIEFIPPDELMLTLSEADLLLVDEAAAIPAQLLEIYLKHYSRIAFATTVHGYEGTGRGFAIRFRKALDRHAPGWTVLRLHTPIRWALDDPLERFIFQALCLDAEPVADELLTDCTLSQCQIQWLDRDRLLADEQLLQQLFGLLVNAHYRTTPDDLRNLLDGPNLSIYVTRYQGHVVGTVLVAKEGEFDQQLAHDITLGNRRPRGHLLPQSIASHLGIEQAGQLRCGRIMRIAIHPSLQGKGLGSALIQNISQQLQQQDYDLLGASFGATVELLGFWQQQAMKLLRVGFTREHTSGAHSVIVAKPLSEPGKHVYAQARRQVSKQLPYQLAEPLQQLDVKIGLALLAQLDEVLPITMDEQDKKDLKNFARDNRGYELTLQPIWQLSLQALIKFQGELTEQQQTVLLIKILQRHPWPQVAKELGLPGRAKAIALLKETIARLITM